MSIIKKIFPDPLILYLVIALVLAYFFPVFSQLQVATIGLEQVIDTGILLVFFFYGLKLKWKEVFNDLLNWRVHLTIQLITFLLFPIIGLSLYPLLSFDPSYSLIFLGIFYLCSLPSTVSSSVVMVSLAKGNVTSAIFNASLSGLIGIILTPLWMSLFLTKSQSIDSSSIVLNLVLQVILPVLVGAFLQPILGKFYERYKNVFSNIDKLTIVLIVYNSFSHTFQDNIFQNFGFQNLVLIAFVVILIFLIVFYLIQILNQKFLKFNREDFITVQFCGTKKSLVHGSVIGSVLFSQDIGIILIPIMIYHTFQLLFISYKASSYANDLG